MAAVVLDDAAPNVQKAKRYRINEDETSYITTLILEYQRSIHITNNTRSTRRNTITEDSDATLSESIIVNDAIIT